MQPAITALFIRHPSYRRLRHPEEHFTLVSSKTAGVTNGAHREMAELMWLFAQDEARHGITDPEILRNFDAIYSTPSVRGVQGCLALSPGLQIRHKPKLPDTTTRRQQKMAFYHRHAWSKEDFTLIPKIIEEEIEQEKNAYAADITILDDLFELLDIPPRWTGASNTIFHQAINRSTFDTYKIERLRRVLRGILQTPSPSPKRYIFMVHGSTMVFLRKYGQLLLQNDWPEDEISKTTYAKMKYHGIPLEELSYHGNGLVLRFTATGECTSQQHLATRKVIETTEYDATKRLIFKSSST